MFGATTLIIAISACAALLPTVSIIQAAFSVSSRACSISHARLGDALADHALLGERLAERDARSDARWHISSSARSARPIRRMQWWMRPGPEPPLRDLEAAALAEQDVRRRHAHVLERRPRAWPCGASS